MRLQVIAGGRTPAAATEHRVLHPRAPMSARAGISATRVPADMWVSPELLHRMRPPRGLRAVA